MTTHCRNVGVMDLHPLPNYELRVTFLIEHRGFMKSLSHANSVECGVLQDSRLGPLLFSVLTNDLPQSLKKACVSMYADNSRVYTSAATVK